MKLKGKLQVKKTLTGKNFYTIIVVRGLSLVNFITHGE